MARQCYYIPPAQDPADHGGYVPSLVIEGVPGHQPMMGRGESAAPWVWGRTLAEAIEVCDSVNNYQGIDRREAWDIVVSSMFPQGAL